MSIPAIIIIVLVSLNLGVALVEDGQTKTETRSFIRILFGQSLLIVLLYLGGFFN